MTLKTRPPTGKVPWPLILIEGGEKTGKSYACAVLSTSKKVGRTLWLDWGEGAADEYGAIPGARYEIIEHDGTWTSIFGQIVAAKEEAQRTADAGRPPVVLIIDSITSEWESLKDWASGRARSTAANRTKLQRDPDAEVTVTMNLWNDASARHRKLMTVLMTFPGIVVITARGGEVALVENGKPVEGKKSYRVDGHKSLAYDASAWLRLSHDGKPVVVGARSVHTGVRPGIDPPQTLPDDWTLEGLVFDALKCDPASAHVRDLVEAKPEATPEGIRDEAIRAVTTPERLRELYREAAAAQLKALEVENESGDSELLGDLLSRLGRERTIGGGTAPPGRVNGHHPQPTDVSASRGLIGIIHQHFARLGYEDHDREERLAFTGRLAGTGPLETSSSLTRDQARNVARQLEPLKDRAELVALLHPEVAA